jgi:hypothetical protein
MSNLKRDLNNFISYLQKINLKEEENLENFIKDKLNEFLIIKTIPVLKSCQYCLNCQTCDIFGFPCINCANICYKTSLGQGYPLHIN